MKRRRAFILFGLLLACVVVFVAWKGRPFYLRPGLVIDHRIPPDAETVVRKWFEESGVPPVPPSFGRFWDSVQSSDGNDLGDAAAILESATEIRVVHEGREWFFVRVDGAWQIDRPSP